MQWTIGKLPGVTFHGFGFNFAGQGVQAKNEGNCWARAIAALLGEKWSFVAKHAALDDITLGQDNAETVDTVKSVNAEIETNAKELKPYRLATAGRWFGKDWAKSQAETAYPRAVGLADHWVVVLGIGYDAHDQPVAVCYWDTDNQVKYDPFNGFTEKSNPQLCYVREAR